MMNDLQRYNLLAEHDPVVAGLYYKLRHVVIERERLEAEQAQTQAQAAVATEARARLDVATPVTDRANELERSVSPTAAAIFRRANALELRLEASRVAESEALETK